MTRSTEDRPLGLAGSDGFLLTVGVVVVLAGVVLGVVRYVGGTPVERGPEGVLGSVALAAVVAFPGALALLGVSGRPALLLPAGMVLVPLAFLSFAGVTLPLLVPAVMLLVAYGRRSRPSSRTGPPLFIAAVVVVLFLAAAIALFAHQDPREYSTPTVSGSTSDVISVAESLTSMALLTAGLAIAWSHADRVPDRRVRPDGAR